MLGFLAVKAHNRTLELYSRPDEHTVVAQAHMSCHSLASGKSPLRAKVRAPTSIQITNAHFVKVKKG